MHSFGTRSGDSPAKINLGLRILRKRPDGFHDLETGIVAIELSDKITIGHARELSMSCSDLGLSTDRTNFCMQVAMTLREVYSLESGAHIYLEKRIPYGAGLGGGSSNAATTLRLCADLWSLTLTDDLMRGLSSSLGSDIPFFISGRPVIATGRGTTLSDLTLPQQVTSLWIGMVHPDIHISTADAYAECAPHDDHSVSLEKIISSVAPDEWKNVLLNDFESTVFKAHPILLEIKDSLYSDGAIYAAMSGSGSSIFGLFKTRQLAIRAVANTHLKNWCGQMVA